MTLVVSVLLLIVIGGMLLPFGVINFERMLLTGNIFITFTANINDPDWWNI